jgi:hypothetical protein
MKLGVFPQMNRAELKRDGLALFSKLIRTKNVEGMQGEAPQGPHDPKKLKLKVSVLLTLPTESFLELLKCGCSVMDSWIIVVRSTCFKISIKIIIV